MKGDFILGISNIYNEVHFTKISNAQDVFEQSLTL